MNPYQIPRTINGKTNSHSVMGTAVAVLVLKALIGIAYLSGTPLLAIVGCLQVFGMFGAIYASLLPLIVLMMLRKKEWTGLVPRATLIAGVMLLSHVSLTAATVELIVRQPFFLDLVPYDNVMAETINIVVPCSLAGLTIAFFATVRGQMKLVVIASVVLALANLSAICYGHYFFATLLGDGLAAQAWWL